MRQTSYLVSYVPNWKGVEHQKICIWWTTKILLFFKCWKRSATSANILKWKLKVLEWFVNCLFQQRRCASIEGAKNHMPLWIVVERGMCQHWPLNYLMVFYSTFHLQVIIGPSIQWFVNWKSWENWTFVKVKLIWNNRIEEICTLPNVGVEKDEKILEIWIEEIHERKMENTKKTWNLIKLDCMWVGTLIVEKHRKWYVGQRDGEFKKVEFREENK